MDPERGKRVAEAIEEARRAAAENFRAGIESTKRDAARTAEQAREAAQRVREALQAARDAAMQNLRAGIERTKRDVARTAEQAREAAKRVREGLGEAGMAAAQNVRTGLQGARGDAGRARSAPSRGVGRSGQRAAQARGGTHGATVDTRHPGEEVRGGYFGLNAFPRRLPEDLAHAYGTPRGLVLTSVEPGGPADQAGLAVGDTLLRVEGEPLHEVRDLLAYVSPERVGTRVHAEVLRAGASRDVTLTVGTPP